MARERYCRSSYDCIVKIKGVTTRPILFSQLNRNDGEELDGMSPEPPDSLSIGKTRGYVAGNAIFRSDCDLGPRNHVSVTLLQIT
ncbi:MAG: hypothetical protein SO121_04190 [Eggerthellaceae bacterium]|nr:hypothetical protein [Eggerthellaceae bacterium]